MATPIQTIVCCLTVAGCGAIAGFAQTTDLSVPPIELEEMIVTASDLQDSLGIPLEIRRAPVSVSGVNAGLNRAQNNLTLSDALENAAGVNTATGNGLHDFFVVRGIDSLNGGLILIDGVLEPEATFYPMHHIAQVQVLKGPGSYLYGANTLAGTVNLVRKAPRFEHFADLRLGGGSHETYEVCLDAGTHDEKQRAAVRLNGTYFESDTHRNDIDRELVSLNPSVLWLLSDRATLRLDVDVQQSDVTPDAGLPVRGGALAVDSRSVTFQEPDDFSEQDVIRVSARVDVELSYNTLLRNRFYLSRLDWETRGTVYAGFLLADLGFEPEPVTLSRFQPALDDEQQVIGNELEYIAHIETGDMEHDLLAGFEVLRFTDDFTLNLPPTTDLNIRSGLRTPSPLLAPLPANTGDARTDILSLYALDALALNARWDVLAGARVDWLDFEDDDRMTSRSDTEFSPFGGVVFHVTEWLGLFANAGKGYGLPSTQVMGRRGEPEESVQVEAGAKWQSEDARWVAQLSGYYIERDQIAIPDSSGVLSENGSQESAGVELELGGEIHRGFTVRGSYGFLDSELDRFSELTARGRVVRDGNTAPLAPKHVGRVWTEYEIGKGWGATLGARGISDQFIAPDNAFEIDGTITLDAAISYEQSRWYAELHLDNLTDEDVYGRGQGAVSVIPEDGVSVMGYVGVRL